MIEGLLGGASLHSDLAGVLAAGPAAASDGGIWVDRHGAVHLVTAHGGEGLLGLRERLERLRLQREQAAAALAAVRGVREQADKERVNWEGEVERCAQVVLEAKGPGPYRRSGSSGTPGTGPSSWIATRRSWRVSSRDPRCEGARHRAGAVRPG